MIVDFVQNKESVELSFVNEKGMIEVQNIFMESDSLDGFFEYVETTDDDPNKLTNVKSFTGKPIKKLPTTEFKGLMVNEFLTETVKEINPEFYNRMNTFTYPLLYSIDIETEITDEFGYSSPELAENKIISISITDRDMNTILFTTDKRCQNISDKDMTYLDSLIHNALISNKNIDYFTDLRKEDKLKYSVKYFENEADMISTFLFGIENYFHMCIGWNVFKYDWKYICTRCSILGISVEKASPVKKLSHEKQSVNGALAIPVKYPMHRILMDYMEVFKASYVYQNQESFSLDYISNNILGLGKVSYDGNLRTLYDNDHIKFLAYSLIDTIIVMLLHRTTNLVSSFLYQSQYNMVPFIKLNQNPITLSLIHRKVRNDGMFILPHEMPDNKFRSYAGGYVKAPVKKESNSCMVVDFSSFYPSSMISAFLSFENKHHDTVTVDNDARPINSFNENKKNDIQSSNGGYCMAPSGRFYKKDDKAILPSICVEQLNNRYMYDRAVKDIYVNIIPAIEERLKSLKAV